MGRRFPKFMAAAVQASSVALDREATTDKAGRLIQEAGKSGARLIVFPETFIPVYPIWVFQLNARDASILNHQLFLNAVEVPSPATEALGKAAKSAGAYLAMGINERAGGTLYNTILFIGPDGSILGRHRKLMPTQHERTIWGMGDESDIKIFATELGRIGGLICFEHSMALVRYALASLGEEIHLAVWPGMAKDRTPFHTGIIDAAIRHYAFEAGVFVVSATCVWDEAFCQWFTQQAGVEERHINAVHGLVGYSAIVDPHGYFLAGPALQGEQILYAEIDLEKIVERKLINDGTGHYARPDIVQLMFAQGEPQPVAVEPKLPAEAASPSEPPSLEVGSEEDLLVNLESAYPEEG